MEFVKPGTYIDFMRHRRSIVGASLALVALSVASMVVPGPNWGIDFAGGTELQLQFQGDVGPDELRSALEELGFAGAQVVTVQGSANEYMIRVRQVSTVGQETLASIEEALRQGLSASVIPCGANSETDVSDGCTVALQCRDQGCLQVSPGGDKLSMQLTAPMDPSELERLLRASGAKVRPQGVSAFGRAEDVRYEAQLLGIADEMVGDLREQLGERGPKTPRRVEWVGPRAGQQLRDAAIKAMLYAIAFIMVYIAFRFDLRFAPGGVLAMAHDVVITFGIYVLVQKEVNLTTVAALLTILGYSINDTIVVYDRIRENMGRIRDASLSELINVSTSQMLSRTIVTSGTTLLSMIAFFIWGTAVIRDIAFALFIGILVGTYSSVYVAAPVTEWMDRRFFKSAVARV
ncbi:MAG: protein translocase subunit SecF [Myxococcota bacterium]